jgi:hypothetical protein
MKSLRAASSIEDARLTLWERVIFNKTFGFHPVFWSGGGKRSQDPTIRNGSNRLELGGPVAGLL